MKDVVCGMDVDEKSAAYVKADKNEIYAFCSKECKDRFEKNPARYEKKATV